MVFKFFKALKNIPNYKFSSDQLKFWSMTCAAFAACLFYVGLEKWHEERPSPMIPAQSFDRYVKIQQEAKREV